MNLAALSAPSGRALHWPPRSWEGDYRLPPKGDPRWAVFGLLACYLILGVTVLGFARRPVQILSVVGFGMVLDVLLSGLLRGRKAFPLSAGISCLSLAILLNVSLGYAFLWMPVFITMASKYVLTFRGKPAFNPSMFGIVACLLLGQGWISLSPAYQWTGTAATASAMSIFLVTAAILTFALRIERVWLIISFLGFYTLQICVRAYFTRYHIPAETLIVGTLTSAPFFLFVFFMITDPGTSPATPRKQVATAFFLVLLDLFYHTRGSLFTFFYAGATLAAIKLANLHIRALLTSPWERFSRLPKWGVRVAFFAVLGLPVTAMYLSGTDPSAGKVPEGLAFQKVSAKISGIGWAKSDILDKVDARVQNVGKWMLSVGDAVATADADGDGRQDLFFTQPLKSPEWRGKLFLNQGEFVFQKTEIKPLEKYLTQPASYGLPSAALFFDYDNDGDEDLFVGFSYGRSHLFRNERIPSGSLQFVEISVPFLDSNSTICLAANALDFDGDGRLDIFMADAISPYLRDYPGRVAFSIFHLPQPEYAGDRRMFNFMHNSWHRSENGGSKHLLLNRSQIKPATAITTDEAPAAGPLFVAADPIRAGISETRWSLSIGTGDLNGDGFSDAYVANDFGRDDCYLNRGDGRFARQQGSFYQDLGLDTYKGMNASIGDMDGDLREDVYVSNVHHALQAEGSLMWMNRTEPGDTVLQMMERATQMGLLNPNRFGWGAAMVDLDLDGRLDLVQANGMVSDEWDKRYPKCLDYWYLNEKLARSPPTYHAYSDNWADIRGACIYGNESNRVYINRGPKGFDDVANRVGLNDSSNTRGVAAVDLDNNGAPDLVITDQFGAPKVYKNLLPANRAWIGLDLAGDGEKCNCDAVGTKVWIAYGAVGARKLQYREVRLGNGFSSQGDKRIIFGMGTLGDSRDPEVTVQWCARGEKQVFTGLAKNRYHALRQDPQAPLQLSSTPEGI